MQNLLKDRLIVISGFGRSGTTVLGKILGSMQPSVYCFEPPILKYLAEFGLTDVPAKLLFETHFLQEFQGRGNMNEEDWSYSGNYIPIESIETRRKTLKRRNDAVTVLEEEQHKFIVKGTELQHDFELMHELFPGVRFVHIIRNGFNSVSSSIDRGWYTDEYCNSAIVENMMPHWKCDIPFFIDRKCHHLWPDWNPATRAACAWRSATTDGIKYKNQYQNRCVQIKYEDFIFQIDRYVDYFEKKFSLTKSELTEQHIKSVKEFNKMVAISDYVEEIMEPERTRFLKLNEKLGYEKF